MISQNSAEKNLGSILIRISPHSLVVSKIVSLRFTFKILFRSLNKNTQRSVKLQPMVQVFWQSTVPLRLRNLWSNSLANQRRLQKDLWEEEKAIQSKLNLLKMLSGDFSSHKLDFSSKFRYLSAVAKIMQHRPDAAPLSRWLERWINWLPVYEDKEESANCYSFLAHLLENGHVSFNNDS